MTRVLSLVVASAALALGLVSTANAASVVYLDGNEVWAASTDGSVRARLSAGEGDWRAVAQSEDGYVAGVRLEAGKIAGLSNFTIWNPDGTIKDFGPLAGNVSFNSEAYPLGFEVTNGGGALVYGYSRCYGSPPCQFLDQGHYILPSATRSAPVPSPYKNTGARWPTLIGDRVVGTSDSVNSSVQEAGNIASTNFVDWFFYGGFDIHRTDVSGNGAITASELEQPGLKRIALGKYAGLGGAYIDDCFLDTDATATHPSISQDGTEFAWQDQGGVKVAGVPNFNGVPTCALTRAPVTISPTGSYPSIGQFNIPAPVVPQILPTNPTVRAPKTAKIAALLKKGIKIKLTANKNGKATIKLTIKPNLVGKTGRKPIVIAKTTANLVANQVKTIKLKLNKKGKSLRRKLKRKKARLSVTVNGKTTNKTIKLK